VRPSKKFTLRVFLYSAALLYLAGDLFLFRGPVKRHLESYRPDSPQSLEDARERGRVALVFGHPIYLSQVERAPRERLWRRGRSLDDLPPAQRRIERLAALNELIDHQLLRVKVQHNADELPVSEEEIDAAVHRLAARFPTPEEMQRELAAEGIDSEKELRLRLGARIQQHRYLESRIADGIAVTEDEAREWFAHHAEDFALPERVKARHVFLATLERDPDEARATLATALDQLRAGDTSFAELAAELSDDPRSAPRGGDLGWMTRERLPDDFGAPLFAMEPLQPQLLRTKLGWHLVEVTERLPAEARRFEDARDEAVAAIEAAKREVMVRRFRDSLRGTERVAIHVFPELIPAE